MYDNWFLEKKKKRWLFEVFAHFSVVISSYQGDVTEIRVRRRQYEPELLEDLWCIYFHSSQTVSGPLVHLSFTAIRPAMVD